MRTLLTHLFMPPGIPVLDLPQNWIRHWVPPHHPNQARKTFCTLVLNNYTWLTKYFIQKTLKLRQTRFNSTTWTTKDDRENNNNINNQNPIASVRNQNTFDRNRGGVCESAYFSISNSLMRIPNILVFWFVGSWCWGEFNPNTCYYFNTFVVVFPHRIGIR